MKSRHRALDVEQQHLLQHSEQGLDTIHGNLAEPRGKSDQQLLLQRKPVQIYMYSE